MESELIPSPPLFTLQNSGDGEAAEEEGKGEGEEGKAAPLFLLFSLFQATLLFTQE